MCRLGLRAETFLLICPRNHPLSLPPKIFGSRIFRLIHHFHYIRPCLSQWPRKTTTPPAIAKSASSELSFRQTPSTQAQHQQHEQPRKYNQRRTLAGRAESESMIPNNSNHATEPTTFATSTAASTITANRRTAFILVPATAAVQPLPHSRRYGAAPCTTMLSPPGHLSHFADVFLDSRRVFLARPSISTVDDVFMCSKGLLASRWKTANRGGGQDFVPA